MLLDLQLLLESDTITSSRTIGGTARIVSTTFRTITGTANILPASTFTSSQTITGKAYILSTTPIKRRITVYVPTSIRSVL